MKAEFSALGHVDETVCCRRVRLPLHLFKAPASEV